MAISANKEMNSDDVFNYCIEVDDRISDSGSAKDIRATNEYGKRRDKPRSLNSKNTMKEEFIEKEKIIEHSSGII